jgi:hypothetical protein
MIAKAITDVGSRCARVEKAFSLDLDAVIAANQLTDLIERVKSQEGRQRLNYIGSDQKWYVSLVNALQKYDAFRRDQPGSKVSDGPGE